MWLNFLPFTHLVRCCSNSIPYMWFKSYVVNWIKSNYTSYHDHFYVNLAEIIKYSLHLFLFLTSSACGLGERTNISRGGEEKNRLCTNSVILWQKYQLSCKGPFVPRWWIDSLFLSSSHSHQGELSGLMWDLQQNERQLLDSGGAVLQQHVVCCWQRWGHNSR